ncbi:DUF1592 domain-containing protein [Phenylobacterium sp.]|uniref:DUF1592 domain-containing protein n=1 Tax=Phenylobacterium sp. TaxID=1871053 RepID=UPI0025F90574|nr:DUF1592 domain-containing protein [Phenylobacterium sp.]
MSMRALALCGVFAVAPLALAGCASDTSLQANASAAKPGEVVGMRRLTAAQYRQSVADIFGADIKVQGRFEPEVRREGLLAVGAAGAAVSAAGMEQYYAMAASIAEQATAEGRRAKLMPCQPASAKAADDVCATQTLQKYGRLLYRRPLLPNELAARVKLAHAVSTQSGDFYAGLREGFTSLLTAPDFLFRIERAGSGRPVDGAMPVDAYARASRLSYMLWNTTPDDQLLRAAETGDLLTPAGLQAQIDRLTASPRLEEGVEAFFDDMLQLELFDHQSKDPAHFPKYSQVVATQAREQTLRTVVDLLVRRNGDYRDIFTSRDTFMTRGLAMVYKVPYASKADWAPYTFPAGSGRSGLLTQISFLSLFSHPARSSPTKRGVALNEIFLCEVTPAPPGDVDFSQVNGDAATVKKTVRLRLEAHATDETCASCHSMVDPPGLALERFDSLGEYREFENGERIDVKAEMDGQIFEGAAGLGMLLHENPRAPACLVRNLFASGAGRPAVGPDKPTAQALAKTFTEGGYRLPAFLKQLAANPALYTARLAPAPALPGATTKVAARSPSSLKETGR